MNSGIGPYSSTAIEYNFDSDKKYSDKSTELRDL